MLQIRNIRLGQKLGAATNTLAYYNLELVTRIKRLYGTGPLACFLEALSLKNEG
jgi:hypothetical protein